MSPAVSRRSAEKIAGKPQAAGKASRTSVELSLTWLLLHPQELPSPPAGVGRVHRLADDEGHLMPPR